MRGRRAPLAPVCSLAFFHLVTTQSQVTSSSFTCRTGLLRASQQVESIVSWVQLIDVQFKAIRWFVAVLQIVMAQFLVMIFGHSAFQGVVLFVNRLHCIKEFEHNAYKF